jgi:hypothetical protein
VSEVNPKVIKKLLETPFWPPELKTDTQYFRTQDDCDGNLREGIEVIIDQMGDAWVNITTDSLLKSCRFRTWGGGGRSLRVRNALLLLAIAIKMDNDDHPVGKPMTPLTPPIERFHSDKKGEDK